MMTFDIVIAAMFLLCVRYIYFVGVDVMILFLMCGRDIYSVGGTCLCHVLFLVCGRDL